MLHDTILVRRPSLRTSCTPICKGKFHRKHKDEDAWMDPEMNRLVKGVALDAPVRGAIVSDLPFNMDKLPVASTAFTGILRDPTREELACTELEAFAEQYLEFSKYDGLCTRNVDSHRFRPRNTAQHPIQTRRM